VLLTALSLIAGGSVGPEQGESRNQKKLSFVR
jgi:hypothetical protein